MVGSTGLGGWYPGIVGRYFRTVSSHDSAVMTSRVPAVLAIRTSSGSGGVNPLPGRFLPSIVCWPVTANSVWPLSTLCDGTEILLLFHCFIFRDPFCSLQPALAC